MRSRTTPPAVGIALNRRQFALTAAALCAGRASAADTVALAVIGPGGMGTNHLKMLAGRDGVRVAAVCDPDADRLAAAAKLVEKQSAAPKAVKDLRRVLDDKSIDAVLIATPDHWHGPAAILAADAGKHVYVEKPCCHNLREGRLMVDAARRNKIVMHVGTQSRSSPVMQQAMQKLRDGIIGDVLLAKAWNSQLRKNLGKAQPSAVPATLDYDLWVGPAAWRAYQANMLPGVWRFFRDFGTGDIGNDGAHELDLGRWGLGVSMPTRIVGLGGKLHFDDDQEFPDTYTVAYEFADGGKTKQLVYEQRIWSPYTQEGEENGVAFYGTKGYMLLGKSSGWRVFGPKNEPGERVAGKADVKLHHAAFVDAIRGARPTSADIEDGHRSASLAHLGNIACRVGRTLSFDPTSEHIANDAEADKLLRRGYRDGHWAVPKGVTS